MGMQAFDSYCDFMLCSHISESLSSPREYTPPLNLPNFVTSAAQG